MTKDDINRMMREAGPLTKGPFDDWCKRFAALVASAEREACAKLAMAIAEQGLPEEMPEGEELLRACEQIAGGVLIADAIRARGTT